MQSCYKQNYLYAGSLSCYGPFHLKLGQYGHHFDCSEGFYRINNPLPSMERSSWHQKLCSLKWKSLDNRLGSLQRSQFLAQLRVKPTIGSPQVELSFVYSTLIPHEAPPPCGGSAFLQLVSSPSPYPRTLVKDTLIQNTYAIYLHNMLQKGCSTEITW